MKIAREMEPDIAQCFDAQTLPRLVGALRGDNWDDYVPEADLLIMNYHRLSNYRMTEADFLAALRALPLHPGALGLSDDAARLA